MSDVGLLFEKFSELAAANSGEGLVPVRTDLGGRGWLVWNVGPDKFVLVSGSDASDMYLLLWRDGGGVRATTWRDVDQLVEVVRRRLYRLRTGGRRD